MISLSNILWRRYLIRRTLSKDRLILSFGSVNTPFTSLLLVCNNHSMTNQVNKSNKTTNNIRYESNRMITTASNVNSTNNYNDHLSHDNNSNNNNNKRIVKTLYRQLIRWCQNVQRDMEGTSSTNCHLSLHTFIPPLHLNAPEQIDPYRMELLALDVDDNNNHHILDDKIVSYVRTILPTKTELSSKHMTIPIHTFHDLQRLFQITFRMNNIEPEHPDNDHRKERIQYAFDAIKSLNDLLINRLIPMKEKREQHINRGTNVLYKVGQIVRHKHDKWRGVITEWDYKSSDNTNQLSDDFSQTNKTSLTTKQYNKIDEDSINNNNVQYHVLLDIGDAYSFGSLTNWSSVSQDDIMLETNDYLCHIRTSNSIQDHFVRYDTNLQQFIPNNKKLYEYPNDYNNIDVLENNIISPATLIVSNEVINGIQELVDQLKQCADATTGHNLYLIDAIIDRFNVIQSGDVLPSSYKYKVDNPSRLTIAIYHLKELLNLYLEVNNIINQRRLSIQHKDNIQYTIGDIVYHKLFHFRGVVVGWDHIPRIDVTKWDGLQHIDKDPMKIPFYHIIPDKNDCIREFGDEKTLRYVCEENLELLSSSQITTSNTTQTLLDVDLDPQHWKYQQQNNDDSSRYEAPYVTRFKYGCDMEDDGLTENFLKKILSLLNHWQYEACQSKIIDNPMIKMISLENMMILLKVVDNLNDAIIVQDVIKEMRKAHPNEELRILLDEGITELLDQNIEKALIIFTNVVTLDNQYIEGWNKRGTCEFMLRHKYNAIESTQYVLSLTDNNHFQALNGLGLIYYEDGEYQLAAELFTKSLTIDPWSPSSSKLSACLDHIININNKDNNKDE